MNIQELSKLIDSIKEMWNESKFEKVRNELLGLQMQAGTPGELLSTVTSFLNDLTINYRDAYGKAKSEIDEIIRYAKSIGYI